MTDQRQKPPQIRADDTRMELKCVVVKPILRYLENMFGDVKTREIVAATGMDPSYLDDAGNWVSYDYFCVLLRKLVAVTGNKRAPFEAASQFTGSGTYEGVGFVFRHLTTPLATYYLIVRFNSLFHRIGEFTILDAGPRQCTIRVRMPQHSQIRENCLAIQGSLAMIPREYGLPLASVTEVACACDPGNQYCVYRLEWIGGSDRRRAWLCALVGVVVGYVASWLLPSFLVGTMCSTIGGAVGYFARRCVDHQEALNDASVQNREQASSLMKTLQASERLNEDLQRRVEDRTENLRKKTQELEKALDDLKASRDRELRAEQQATLGIVAGGMAHELNSPLNAVLLSLQEVREDLPADSSLREALRRAERASTRCKRIINDVLICSREPRRDAVLDVRDIVRGTVDLYERDHPGEVRVVRRFAGDLPGVTFDQVQVQQVVTNLLKNAADAMGSQGEVDVDLCVEEDNIVLRVSDRGPGVPDEEKERIFMPLHSTKGGRGLGLGLSITRQLVWRNNGTIAVRDREGGGAVFVVNFPIQQGGIDAAGKVASREGAAVNKREGKEGAG